MTYLALRGSRPPREAHVCVCVCVCVCTRTSMTSISLPSSLSYSSMLVLKGGLSCHTAHVTSPFCLDSLCLHFSPETTSVFSVICFFPPSPHSSSAFSWLELSESAKCEVEMRSVYFSHKAFITLYWVIKIGLFFLFFFLRSIPYVTDFRVKLIMHFIVIINCSAIMDKVKSTFCPICGYLMRLS